MAFGSMMFLSVLRFWTKGWIEDLYIAPAYYFPYYGFEFVVPLGEYTYVLFALCGLSALFVAIGFFYRWAMFGLFVSFTYIELIDKSTYLNHYYFVSMVCLIMLFLPAATYFSVDATRSPRCRAEEIPQWCIDVLKYFVSILYFYAGLAKLNTDWLLHALPLKIWLPAKNDTPLIGWLFNYRGVHFAFSWIGCLYDLAIPFLLWNKKTRLGAYIAVIIFHLLTSLLFPIGMFPYIMIVTALVFFSPRFHERLMNGLRRLAGVAMQGQFSQKYQLSKLANYFLMSFFTVFFAIQLLFPFRYLLYPGELFWTEEGFRFSWRVMLMEKAGYAQFTIRDRMGKTFVVNNDLFLTDLQEKMMATQPDMILQYAHMLRDYYIKKGILQPQVYVDSYVALNGRLGRPLIDPTVDLAQERESFRHKPWIVSFDDEIKGF